jgi:hypothetical protein
MITQGTRVVRPGAAATRAALATLLLCSCGGGDDPTSAATQDDTAAVQAAVDRGGVVSFGARTYYLSRTIVVSHSNTTIQGMGPQTIFQYRASAAPQHCLNDRVFTTPCGIDDSPPRRIAGAISIGDESFSASAPADVADLQSGDWLLISDIDSVIGDRVDADWVQVDSVAGLRVYVRAPFRTAFTDAREWDPGHSGLGFQRIAPLVENIAFRNFSFAVPDAGPHTGAAGLSVFNALNTTIDHVVAEDYNGQPLYSYLAKNLTVTNSEGRGHAILSEFAATVDLNLHDNHFSEDAAAGLGLDLGTAFFEVSDNYVDMSSNIGAYLLYGVHDGTFAANQIAAVGSSGGGNSAFGLLVWGTQNVNVTDNYLAGGAGPQSTGISVRSVSGEIPMPSNNVQLVGNTFGDGWVLDYEAGTVPSN